MARRKKNLMMITLSRKVPYVTRWKHDTKFISLGTIINSARSRIGILADGVICNRNLRYDTWRWLWLIVWPDRVTSLNGDRVLFQAGAQYVTDNSTETDLDTKNWGIPLRTWMWILISVTKKLAQSTLKERSCERRNHRDEYKAIELIKSGSNKNCIREDLAKEKMMFSQETSKAVVRGG